MNSCWYKGFFCPFCIEKVQVHLHFSLWGWWSTGTGCPGRLWSLLLWRYSRASRVLLRQGDWTRWPTEVPSNPYHSVILWEAGIQNLYPSPTNMFCVIGLLAFKSIVKKSCKKWAFGRYKFSWKKCWKNCLRTKTLVEQKCEWLSHRKCPTLNFTFIQFRHFLFWRNYSNLNLIMEKKKESFHFDIPTDWPRMLLKGTEIYAVWWHL